MQSQAAIAFTSSLGTQTCTEPPQVQRPEKSCRDGRHFQGHGIHCIVTARGSIGLVMDGRELRNDKRMRVTAKVSQVGRKYHLFSRMLWSQRCQLLSFPRKGL